MINISEFEKTYNEIKGILKKRKKRKNWTISIRIEAHNYHGEPIAYEYTIYVRELSRKPENKFYEGNSFEECLEKLKQKLSK